MGSVAFYFNQAIESAAEELGLTIGKIIQRPIDDLVNYHKNYILKENNPS